VRASNSVTEKFAKQENAFSSTISAVSFESELLIN